MSHPDSSSLESVRDQHTRISICKILDFYFDPNASIVKFLQSTIKSVSSSFKLCHELIDITRHNFVFQSMILAIVFIIPAFNLKDIIHLSSLTNEWISRKLFKDLRRHQFIFILGKRISPVSLNGSNWFHLTLFEQKVQRYESRPKVTKTFSLKYD